HVRDIALSSPARNSITAPGDRRERPRRRSNADAIATSTRKPTEQTSRNALFDATQPDKKQCAFHKCSDAVGTLEHRPFRMHRFQGTTPSNLCRPESARCVPAEDMLRDSCTVYTSRARILHLKK